MVRDFYISFRPFDRYDNMMEPVEAQNAYRVGLISVLPITTKPKKLEA